MKKFILPALLLSATISTNAFAGNEIWSCKSNGMTIDTVFDANEFTKVDVGGQVIDAFSYMDGFNRRWDSETNGTEWSLVIRPDNTGYYYKFRDDSVTQPLFRLTCKNVTKALAEEKALREARVARAEASAKARAGILAKSRATMKARADARALDVAKMKSMPYHKCMKVYEGYSINKYCVKDTVEEDTNDWDEED